MSEPSGGKVATASKDALAAFKMFATNPVPGLSTTYESLGPARALGVGVVFGAVFAVALLLGVYRFLPQWTRPQGIGGFFAVAVVAIVPYISLFAASFVVRTVFRGQGSWGSDGFLAGAALLPFALVALLVALLGSGNAEVVAIVALFAVCLTILMLFAGLTRIQKTSERAATLAVPLMVMVSGWFSKIIYTALLQRM